MYVCVYVVRVGPGLTSTSPPSSSSADIQGEDARPSERSFREAPGALPKEGPGGFGAVCTAACSGVVPTSRVAYATRVGGAIQEAVLVELDVIFPQRIVGPQLLTGAPR